MEADSSQICSLSTPGKKETMREITLKTEYRVCPFFFFEKIYRREKLHKKLYIRSAIFSLALGSDVALARHWVLSSSPFQTVVTSALPPTADLGLKASFGIKLLSAEGHYLHIRPLSERSQALACLPGLAFCPHSLVWNTQTALQSLALLRLLQARGAALSQISKAPAAFHSQENLSTLG